MNKENPSMLKLYLKWIMTVHVLKKTQFKYSHNI